METHLNMGAFYALEENGMMEIDGVFSDGFSRNRCRDE